MSAKDRVYEQRWLTLAVLSLSLVIIGLDNTILNIAIPTLQQTFQASASELQWMVDSYILVFAGLLLTMGRSATVSDGAEPSPLASSFLGPHRRSPHTPTRRTL